MTNSSDGDKTTMLTLNFLNIACGTKAKTNIYHTKIVKSKPAATLTEEFQ